MTPNQYQKLAARTINPNLSPELQIANAALGIVGEFAELRLARANISENSEKIQKEIGDVLWYIAQACTTVEIDLSEIVSWGNHPITLFSFNSESFCNYAKKIAFHGHKMDRDEMVRYLRNVYHQLERLVGADMVREAAPKNIDKLRKRYPEGFSEEASINRES